MHHVRQYKGVLSIRRELPFYAEQSCTPRPTIMSAIQSGAQNIRPTPATKKDKLNKGPRPNKIIHHLATCSHVRAILTSGSRTRGARKQRGSTQVPNATTNGRERRKDGRALPWRMTKEKLLIMAAIWRSVSEPRHFFFLSHRNRKT